MRKALRILRTQVENEFLPFVRRPSRYIGGEINQIRKDLAACDVTVALAFPDIYEIGMSHTGLAILYDAVNRRPGLAAERVFAPWIDAEPILREKAIPLYTLESMAAAADFDFFGFSLTNELCYTNLLNMLDLAAIPIRSADRTDDHPLILIGGQSANTVEPIAPFVDLALLGEADEALVEVLEFYRDRRSAGDSRAQFLEAAARQFEFVYVPALYDLPTHGDTIAALEPKKEGLPTQFANAIVRDLDTAPVPEKPIVPFAQAVHERISVEVMRGCPGRCRFCQASYCRRPIRCRGVDRILEIARRGHEATGFDTVSLLSLSTADYPHIEELVTRMNEYFAPRHVGVSLPSLKVQTQLRLLPKMVASVRKGGLTIAVEAASERLRRVINKPITDDDLLAAVAAAYEAGYRMVKLYFMVGLPGETEDDIRRIVDLSCEIAARRRDVDGKFASVNAAVSWLVPKAHTPFQWLGQQSRDYFENARRLLLDRKKELRAKYVQLKFHEIEASALESAMGRGDRRLADVIETAWRNGARFDLWTETFDFPRWRQAFQTHGLDLDAAAQRSFAPEDPLPWQHLGGPRKSYLQSHHQNAQTAAEDTASP